MTVTPPVAANEERQRPGGHPRPTIAICAALVQARWGSWDRPAYLLAKEYVAAVQRAGALALIVPPDESVEHNPDQVLDVVDGLMLAGGSDIDPSAYGQEPHPETKLTVPERDRAELALARAAAARDMPVLGICRGMQLINVYQGGTLVPHLEDGVHQLEDGQRHDVRIDGTSALSRLLDATRGEVTSSHHQAVDSVGKDLRAVSHHADGTIEAIEWIQPLRKPWLAAVQWHPERMALHEPLAGALFCGFLEAVAAAHG